MERYSTGRVRADGSDGSAPTKGAGGAAQHPAAIAANGKAKRVLIHCRDEDRNRATAVDLAPRWCMLLSALPDAFRQVAQATRALVTTSPGLNTESVHAARLGRAPDYSVQPRNFGGLGNASGGKPSKAIARANRTR